MNKILITLLCAALIQSTVHCRMVGLESPMIEATEGDPFGIRLPIEKEGEIWRMITPHTTGPVILLNNITQLSGKRDTKRKREQVFTHKIVEPLTENYPILFEKVSPSGQRLAVVTRIITPPTQGEKKEESIQ